MPSIVEPRRARASGHGWVPIACAVTVAAMVGGAYAAVPFYRAFCEATGWDGTVKRVEKVTAQPIARTIVVRFDTNVRGLPWTFRPEQLSQTIHLGAPGMAFFTVRNDSDKPLTGRASYNVVPESAGAYFVKTQCFCFNAQTVPAHTQVRFPVLYFVQPRFDRDRETRLFQEVTLSYTFFPVAAPASPATAAQGRSPSSAPVSAAGAAKAA